MTTYNLINRQSGERINKITCFTYDQAVIYFSIVKRLSKKDLLDIFTVVNN